jgi:elongator complex protein 1
LNLLIDFNPQNFLDKMKDFVLQIENIHWLNLFLTELKNEDVTVTMYKFCEKSPEVTDESYNVDMKIRFVCEKMLKIFEELDPKKFMLPSITCHVKNESFENALQMIWELKK